MPDIRPAPEVFVATFESRNFSFTAVGRTDQEARDALRAGLSRHAKQYGLGEGWFREDDFNVDGLPFDGCLRDHSLI